MSDEQRTIDYRYEFHFEDGNQIDFVLRLDHDSLSVVHEEEREPPQWTDLGFKQCQNCPLSKDEHPRCPVAVNVAHLIETFRSAVSHEAVRVRVQSPQRIYEADTSLQKGVGALLGILMVTSGCPVLNRLRPMVETHLPFMNLQESTYRIISMYLLAQYFRHKSGESADWDLDGLMEFLGELDKVNEGFCDRLRTVSVQDANLNALVNLGTTSGFTKIALESNWLDRLQGIFREHAGW